MINSSSFTSRTSELELEIKLAGLKRQEAEFLVKEAMHKVKEAEIKANDTIKQIQLRELEFILLTHPSASSLAIISRRRCVMLKY